MKLKVTAFLLLISISIFSQNNPNDCTNAIIICGNSNLGIDPSGIGFNEFSLPGNNTPPCYVFDQNNIWFKFEILNAGIFTFDLIPDNGVDDYDFAIFGPNVTCTTLGNSIRCSSTNPQAAGVPVATGLNQEETDTEEGPGVNGNGYLKYIDAQAGDIYYLLVDRAEGSGPFSLFYTGSAILPPSVVANEGNDIINCDSDGTLDGFTEFNLDSQISTIAGSQTGVMVTFHESLNDAAIGINDLTSPYTNISNPQTIYARIEKNNGCSDLTTFTIEIGNPTLMNPDDVVLCSYNASETYILNSIITEVIGNPAGYVFSYHNSNTEAINNTNPIGATVNFTEIPQNIYVRVTDENDPLCYNVTSFTGYINRIQLASQPTNVLVCDDNFDGFTQINLSDKKAEILGGLPASDFEIFFYTSQEDRINQTGSISGVFENTENPQTLYISMLETATGCFDYAQFEITVSPKPIPLFEEESYIYCLNATEPLPISVQSGFYYYEWSTGEEGASLNTIYIDAQGVYTVTVTSEFGCTNDLSVEVLPSNIATITDVLVEDFQGTENTITILAEGPGDYEYALDNEFYYADSNIFTGLLNKYYTVYVRDKNGCGVVSKEILVLDYPRFFTPNKDGFHDYWKIIGISEFPKTKIYIYDRLGKLLKEILPDSSGWDGTNLKNKPLPSSDYWFTIAIENRPVYKGHFALKR